MPDDLSAFIPSQRDAPDASLLPRLCRMPYTWNSDLMVWEAFCPETGERVATLPAGQPVALGAAHAHTPGDQAAEDARLGRLLRTAVESDPHVAEEVADLAEVPDADLALLARIAEDATS